jgi:hypothetical protein
VTYHPGENGNKGGRPKYSGEWGDAIRKALHEEDKKTRMIKLHRAARALIAKALEGDVPALREIGDRIDGKASQPVTHDVAGSLEQLILASMAPDEPG